LPQLPQFKRRALLKSIVSLSLASVVPGRGYALFYGSDAHDPEAHTPLPARAEGEMDIHHIDTGRGNCTLVVGPDGTAIMVDAGASNAPAETSGEARPDSSRRPGEWQAGYALRQVPRSRLDYLVVTHVHPDHIGDVNAQTPLSDGGSYRLTGVSDVDRLVPIDVVIDRAYPDYGMTRPPASPFADNYFAYLKDRVMRGRKVQRVQVGSDVQISLRHAERYPNFKARMLAASGRVWAGEGDRVESRLPDLKQLSKEDCPNENFYSVAMRFSYGRFSYFTGGDLMSDTQDGRLPWMDIETPVVRAAGRTEVAAADHHGYFDACGPEFVRQLDAQAYVIQSWDVGHPGSAQMQRMLGDWAGRATHDVFATDLLAANQLINRRFVPQLKSRSGHVVVRVAAGGGSYRIFVVDSARENGSVMAVCGPYVCRA
jgi:glyoxylase-like metal-dependent hydrolase (beta-lactamase superfamily II)